MAAAAAAAAAPPSPPPHHTDARTTRSRSTNPPPQQAPPRHTPPPPPPPCSRSSLKTHLCRAFPGRSREIKELLSLLGEPIDFLCPLLVYGGASTGKTSILTQIFRHLHRPFAFVSCRSCHSPRLLFESVLNQLLGHARTAANKYASAKKCEKLVDFVDLLPDACRQALARKAQDGKALSSPSKKGSAAGGGPASSVLPSDAGVPNSSSGQDASSQVVYLIFDNVELLLDWTGGFRLVSALFKLSEFTFLPNLGLIFISSLGPDAFYFDTGALQPLPVYFRDYTDEELHQILVRRKPHSDLYSSFLSGVMKPFSRATRRVTELAEALEPLYQKYQEPILCGAVKPDEQGKRKLFSLLKPHITPALNQAFSFSDYHSTARSTLSSVDKGGKKNFTKKAMVSNSEELDFQLSLCSKYLLLAAFICSRNPPTLDATLFDSGGGMGMKKRKRKSSQTNIEKKELERQEKILKGPGSFPLERLLAIFNCISAEMNEFIEELEAEQFANEGTGGMEVTGDVLMQISTLVNANILYKGSSDPIDGSGRYRCNADEELVQTVARSISFPLSRYLYRS